jgi:GAF domain-containing protein
MSENWNKKQLHKRLNTIFTDLDKTSDIPGLSIFNTMSGWIWEINTQGIITKCSPDIEPFLGYKPETILNQPLSAISDFNLMQDNLPTSETSSIVPSMIEMNFYHVKGTKTASTVYVFPRFNSNKKFMGWRGVTILTPVIPSISLPKRTITPTTEPELPLLELLSPDEIAEPVPSQLVHKPEFITDISPETREALELIEQEELEQKEVEILIEESFALPVPKPSKEVKEFLKSIDPDSERVWEPEELQLVEQVHSQLELALENANLFQQTQQALAETDEQARRLRLLNEMSEKLTQVQTLIEIYTITADTTAEIFDASRTSISLFTDNQDEMEIFVVAGEITEPPPGEKVEYQESIHQTAIQEKRIIINPQIKNPDPEGIQSSIIGPISAASEMLGILNIGSKQPNAFNKQDESFLAQLLTLLNSVIENRKLFDEIENALSLTEEQAQKLAELNYMGELLSQADSFEDAIAITMQQIDAIIPCEICLVAIPSVDKQILTTYQRQPGADEITTTTIQAENTLLQEVIQDKRIYSNAELSNTTYSDAQELANSNKIRSLLASPLLTGVQAIGTILIGTVEEVPYTSQDETLIQSIGSIFAATIENRKLFQQIQRRSLQLVTSAEVSRIATTILDPAELLPEVVELIKNGFDLYYAGIFLIDGSGDWTGEPNRWAVLRAGSGEAGQQMIANNHKLEIGGDSMIGTSISNAEARIAHNVGEEARFFKNPYLLGTRSEIALPLISRGQVLGALSIQSEKESAFSQEDITSLQTLADQLANAIENARLFEQTEVRAEELAILNEMARSYTQTLVIEQLIDITHQFADRLMDAQNFYLALFDSETEIIEFKLFIEEGEKIPPPEPKLLLGEGLTDWIIKNKLPILMPSNIEEHISALGLEVRGRLAQSWLGVPMLLENKVLGVIAVQSYRQPNTYASHELDLLSAVANQAAVAIDNAMRFQQSQARARFEQLLREITTRVHSSTNAESILRTAVREVSNALGKQAFIELNPALDGENHTETQPENDMNSALPLSDENPQKGER